MKVARKIIVIIVTIAVIFLLVLVGIMVFYDPYEYRVPQVSLLNGREVELGTWKVEVSDVSSAEPLTGFEVVLTKNQSIIEIPATSLDTMSSTCSGNPGISFVDSQDDGRLNGEDWFTVCGTDSVSEYEVDIFWKATGYQISGRSGRITP